MASNNYMEITLHFTACARTMPRTARCCSGGYTYHVLNRGNARGAVFHGADDSDAFLDLMAESSVRTPMRILA